MRRKLINALSWCLSLAVLLSLLVVSGISVSADTTWVVRTTYPTSSDPGYRYYSPPINNYVLSPINQGNCTWYAYGRAYEVYGQDSGLGNAGHAGSWYSYAQSIGLPVGTTPKAGSIICWAGHVGFVESVSGSTVTWTDSSYQSSYDEPYKKFSMRTEDPHGWGGLSLIGYIYLCDVFNTDPIEYTTVTGDYYFRNRSTGEYMSVAQSVDANGQDVMVWSFTGETGMQMEVSSDSAGQKIRPACTSSRAVSIYKSPSEGANVNITDDAAASTQRWGFESVGDGYYVVRSKSNPALVLTQRSNSVREVCVKYYTGSQLQHWKLEEIQIEEPDTTPPVIENVEVVNVSQNGYQLLVLYSDDVGVTRVEFPTWIAGDSTDKIVWYQSASMNDAAAFINVDVANHGYRGGQYITDVYVYDAVGNYTVQTCTVNVPQIDLINPVVSDVRIESKTEYSYRVSCTVSDDEGVTEVLFPTWTQHEGQTVEEAQDDIVWHSGWVYGNTAYCDIYTFDHNDETGRYITHVYAYDKEGNEGSGGTSVLMSYFLELGVERTAGIFKVGESQHFSFTPSETDEYLIYSTSGGDAQLYVEDEDGNQLAFDDDSGEGFDFRLQTTLVAGQTYIMRVRFYDEGTGYLPFVVKRVERDTTPPTISAVKADNITENGYHISCNVSDNVGVTSVKFHVWTARDGQSDAEAQDDAVWYEGTIDGNTAYCDISTSHHNGETGYYYTQIYVYDEAGNVTEHLEIVEVAPSTTLGDVNGDGTLDTVDARYILGVINSTDSMSEELKRIADVNGDGKVNSSDVRRILIIVLKGT